MPYIAKDDLKAALNRLHGTADHLIKIWFCLKQMGFTRDCTVEVTTTSPEAALKRLFDYTAPDGELFIPFAHTKRFMTMKSDASRSIIQTTIARWGASGSVVTVDPTGYLRFSQTPAGAWLAMAGRSYPNGLGHGKAGFALNDETRVAIPDIAFAMWYYRQTLLPKDVDARELRARLQSDLFLTSAEIELVFVEDDFPDFSLREAMLPDADLRSLVQRAVDGSPSEETKEISETLFDYQSRVRAMTTVREGPKWLTTDPVAEFRQLVDTGAKAILLFGPPRTGKTRAVDAFIVRTDEKRETIQIHNGWGYDELVMSLRPKSGDWVYETGPLLAAIRKGKKVIVLEEINRTDFSQALGEVFSLLEDGYRGEEYSILLRDGVSFHVPNDVLFVFTMNNLDKSTEQIDDALLGRVAAVEFFPRVEDLHVILQAQGVNGSLLEKVKELFGKILSHYPLGHGYFVGFGSKTDPIGFYRSRIRPVLQSHLGGYKDSDLADIDEKVDQLFGKPTQ